MATSRLLALALSALALACAARRPAAAPGADPLPLVAAGGEATTLAALAGAQDATVLVFWSAGCPCVRRYQERADALLEAFPAGRVKVVGVSSNAGETLEEALRVARERGVRLPILRDEGGRVAAAVGARSTPAAAVLDREGRVRYLGWIDNERPPGAAGREPWLEQAVAGVLDGSAGFPSRRPTYGCAITRSLSLGGPEASPCCSAR